METFYVVKQWEGTDVCDYVAGPFRWYHEACEAKENAGYGMNENYSIVHTLTKVEL